jgi:hypothetical protein
VAKFIFLHFDFKNTGPNIINLNEETEKQTIDGLQDLGSLQQWL